MRFIVTFGVLLFLSSNATFAADVAKGKAIAETQCVACHGPKGNSANADWPKLAGQGELYLIKQLKNFKSGMSGKGDMQRKDPVMGTFAVGLSDQDMANIAAYYAKQKVSRQGVKAEFMERGKQLYWAGDEKKGIPACTACHGPKGNGLNLAKYPALAGQHPAYTISQMNKFQSGERNNDENKVMRMIAEKMNANDIEAVAQFLVGLH